MRYEKRAAPRSTQRTLGTLGVSVLLAVTTLVVSAGCSRAPSDSPGRLAPESVGPDVTIRQEWGIDIKSLRVTSGGYFLDFRYRVTDAQKAKPLFDGSSPPYVIDQKSGARFMVFAPPKVGPMRPKGTPLVGRQYVILFANPARYVKPGDRLTVVIGKMEAKDLVVASGS